MEIKYKMSTLIYFSEISILTGIICAVIISIDVYRNPQAMGIMNIVWPVTALYAGPVGLAAYYYIGRKKMHHQMPHRAMPVAGAEKRPFWQTVVIGTLHCGAGCTLGDIFSEIFLWYLPVTLFGSALYGGWLMNFVFAFCIGIVFQYYAIKPMRRVTAYEALTLAIKADALSLTFWQIGMYGWMAFCFFVIFNDRPESNHLVFWWMMQIAMVIGFLTAYPVNWWLIKKGIKEAM
jgi:hypothetical protein